jgi:ubiquinone/menaquinone biosynthesis C-methylase UbiE
VSPLSQPQVSPRSQEDPDLEEYYIGIARAFDDASKSYDNLYQEDRIMAWMRRENLAAIQASFAQGSRLLEIGCGTGDEALALARNGYRVVATDISPGMIAASRAKAQAEETEGVTWVLLPAGRLSDLIEEEGPGAFDGAYASFGALNCEPDLAPVAETLSRLVRPGGELVCSVMNRWCVWEIGWGLLHLRPGEAFRRAGEGWLPAGLASPDGTQSVLVRYYTPRSFARAFAPHFVLTRVSGLPVVLPPPYLSHLVERWPVLMDRGEQIDRRLRDRFPFHSLGDHFLMVMKRTGERATNTVERR